MFAGSRRNAGGLLDPLEVPRAPPDGDDLPVRVASGVVAPILLLLVEAPVGVEVPAAPQGPEAEDRFGPPPTPAGPRAGPPHPCPGPGGPLRSRRSRSASPPRGPRRSGGTGRTSASSSRSHRRPFAPPRRAPAGWRCAASRPRRARRGPAGGRAGGGGPRLPGPDRPRGGRGGQPSTPAP